MTQAKKGDKVTVHYTGKLADGSIFDSSEGEEPLIFTIGDEELIEGFEEGVMGMAAGEKKTVTIAPDKAYGEPHDDMLLEVPLSEMPDDMELEVGDELELTNEEDEPTIVLVSQLNDKSVILDGNPPLAGETLTFDLELVTIG